MSESYDSDFAGRAVTTAGNYARDYFERIAATAAEGFLAYAAVEVADLPVVWVPVGTALLAVVKGFLAKFISPQNASASVDPAVRS